MASDPINDALADVLPELVGQFRAQRARQEHETRLSRAAAIIRAIQDRPTRTFEDEAQARGILMPEERTVQPAGSLPSERVGGGMLWGGSQLGEVDLGQITPESGESALLETFGGVTPEYAQFANRLETLKEEESVRKVLPVISDITGVDMAVLQSGGLTGLKTILPFLKLAQEGTDASLKTVTVYNKQTGDAEIMTFDPGTGEWGRTPFLAVPKSGAGEKGPPALVVNPSTGRIDFDPTGVPTTGGGGGTGGGVGGRGTAGGVDYGGAPGSGATLGAETEKRIALHRKAESDVTSMGQDLAAIVNLARQPVALGKAGATISRATSAAQQVIGLLRSVGVPLSERTFETTTGNVNRRLKSRLRVFIRRAAALTSPDRRLSNEEEKRMLDLVDSGDPTQIINGARELYRSVLESNIGEAARLGVESRFAKPPTGMRGGATGRWEEGPQTLFEGGEFSVRPAPFAHGPEQFLSPEAEAGAGLLALETGTPAYQGQEVRVPESALPPPIQRGPLRLWFNPATKQFEPVPEGTTFEEEDTGVGVRRVLPGGANAPQGR